MKYTYPPLPSGHIRLLKIEPAEIDSAPLRCRTSYHQLHRAPAYTAISYTWGRSPAREAIVCDDRVLEVSASSAAALRAVRQPTRAECVWIDAICINQADDGERNAQVARMGGIFFGARRTKIWLGVELEEWAKVVAEGGVVGGKRPASARGQRRKSELLSRRVADGGDRGPRERGASIGEEGTPTASSVTREMLLSLFQRPWFTRLWVIQELLLSRRVLIIVRRGLEIEWDAIRHLAADFRLTASSRLLGMRAELGRVSEGKLGAGKLSYGQLPDILAITRDFHCQDPRDKLFAVLSLFSLPLPERIRPDYRKSVAQVYRDLTLFLLEMGHPDCFRNVVGAGAAGDAPSWAYDWKSEDAAADGHHGGGPWRAHVSSPTSSAGSQVGKGEIRSRLCGEDAVALRGMVLGTVTRVVVAEPAAAVRRGSTDGPRGKSPHARPGERSFRYACEVRRSDGKVLRIPVVPRATQAGDSLCLFLGFPGTFILRRASSGWFQRLPSLRRLSGSTAGPTYRLVGECDYHDDDENTIDGIDWDSVGEEQCRPPLADFILV